MGYMTMSQTPVARPHKIVFSPSFVSLSSLAIAYIPEDPCAETNGL